MLTFCPMQVEHLGQVLAIEKQSFSNPWSQFAFVNELLHNDYAHYLVAMQKGKMVGYAGMWLILDEAHITNIAVAPPHRRQGIGQSILEALLSWAQSLGAASATLEVRQSNIQAQKMYEKFGFVKRGRRLRYYSDNNEDAIIMWKDHLAKTPQISVGESRD